MVVVEKEGCGIVDGAQIEHWHLPMFTLGVTNPQHD